MSTKIYTNPFVVDLGWKDTGSSISVTVPSVKNQEQVTQIVRRKVDQIRQRIAPILEETMSIRNKDQKKFMELVIKDVYDGRFINNKGTETCFFWDPKKVKSALACFNVDNVDSFLNNLNPEKPQEQAQLAYFKLFINDFFEAIRPFDILQPLAASFGVNTEIEKTSPIEFRKQVCNLPIVKSIAYGCFKEMITKK